jgi:hypothetical protein
MAEMKAIARVIGAALALSVVCSPGPILGQAIYTPYTVTTVAGATIDADADGMAECDYADGTGSEARFCGPGGLAVDSAGNIYLADTGNNVIRKTTPTGVVSTFAGLVFDANGDGYPDPGYADGVGSEARFNSPRDVAVDNAGDLYVADTGNNIIRKITAGGVVTTLAGSTNDFDGDGWPDPGSADGPGSEAQFSYPEAVAVDAAGNVYVADTVNYTIRKITPAGEVTTLAGLAGDYGFVDGTNSDARFRAPAGVTVDAAGNLYVADGVNNAIRKIDPVGVVTTFAGIPLSYGFADGSFTNALFGCPQDVAVGGSGNLYVSDGWNWVIRRITSAGLVTTMAGRPGAPGSVDGTGKEARFGDFLRVAADPAGNVYVADNCNGRIRKLTPSCICVITNQAQMFAMLFATPHTNGWVTLTWESCSDHLYEIQTAADLSDRAVWMARALVRGADPLTSWTDTNAAPAQRFYRVQRLAFTGDEDGDGYTNVEEHRAGTGLHDAASHPTNTPPNLVAWWEFEETVGYCVFDSTPFEHHAVLGWGNPDPTAGDRTPGVMSRALGFGYGYYSGSGFIRVPYAADLPPPQTGTLTAWVKPIVPKWDPLSGMGTFYGFVSQSSNLEFHAEGGRVTARVGQQQINTDRLVIPKQWHLLSLAYSPSNLAVFLDDLCPINANVNLQPLTPAALILGRISPGAGYVLDDVRIYSRPLDLPEIQMVYNADTDGDGIPNRWMATWLGQGTGTATNATLPTDDYDGDGFSNMQEYRLHTRPNLAYHRPAQLPRNLAAWWKLDEGAGTVVRDASLNEHQGALLGSNPGDAWTTGFLSNAITLGGPSSNWIQVPYHSSLVSTQQFTLAGWVKPFGQGVVIGNWDPVGQVYGNYQLRFGPEEVELRFSLAGDGSYETIQSNPNWTTNEWHHVAASYSGTILNLFVDGELRGSRSVSGNLVRAQYPITIGFPGVTERSVVDDVRVYNRALSINQIAALSRGNGLPTEMIVGQTASLRAFGVSESCASQWGVISGVALLTNTAAVTTDLRPSWSGAAGVQVVSDCSGLMQTNLSSTAVSFPTLSPMTSWDTDPGIRTHNNCYNYATDVMTGTFAQPGGGTIYQCGYATPAAVSDGLIPGVDLADLCATSGLPEGHIVALLIWPGVDFHWLRMEADGTWSHKMGSFSPTARDNSNRVITDPRTANFGNYQFCGFFWVGPDVRVQ